MRQLRTHGQWAAWDITVHNRDGVWAWREMDPAQALAKARMQQFTPPITDHFGQTGAVKRLIDGHELSVWCHDGTQITIRPALM